jgi:tetratricopeptide (TPR) repeat protein
MARMSIVRICWDLGWHERALEEGQKALDQNPNNVDALICMARAYNNSGMAEKAIPLVSKVIEVEPMNSAASKLLIFNYVMTKQYKLACEKSEVYLKRNPKDSNTCWVIALGYFHMGEIKRAIEVAQFGLQADPANFTLWQVLGYAYKANGETETAVRIWNSGIEAILDHSGDRRNYRARSWLASLYAATGKREEALKEIIEIFNAKSDNGYMLYRLASAYAELKMEEEAVSMLRLAIENGFLSIQMMRHEELLTLRSLHGNPEYESVATELELKVDKLRKIY